MVKTIRARFSRRVIEPLEKVEFPENEELKITIDDIGAKKQELMALLEEVWLETGEISEKEVDKTVTEAIDAVRRKV